MERMLRGYVPWFSPLSPIIRTCTRECTYMQEQLEGECICQQLHRRPPRSIRIIKFKGRGTKCDEWPHGPPMGHTRKQKKERKLQRQLCNRQSQSKPKTQKKNTTHGPSTENICSTEYDRQNVCVCNVMIRKHLELIETELSTQQRERQ